MAEVKVAVRFGVGDGRSKRASTWTCWTMHGKNRNDVYLGCRELRGALKTSLHESGQWHLAFRKNYLTEHANDPAEWDSRFVDTWVRPEEQPQGFIRACQILTPLGAVLPRAISAADQRKVAWILPPPADHAVETTMVITRSELPPINWPGRRSMGTELVGSLHTQDGAICWIGHRIMPMPIINSSFNRQRFFNNAALSDFKGQMLRAVLLHTASDGCRVMIEVASTVGDPSSQTQTRPAD